VLSQLPECKNYQLRSLKLIENYRLNDSNDSTCTTCNDNWTDENAGSVELDREKNESRLFGLLERDH